MSTRGGGNSLDDTHIEKFTLLYEGGTRVPDQSSGNTTTLTLADDSSKFEDILVFTSRGNNFRMKPMSEYYLPVQGYWPNEEIPRCCLFRIQFSTNKCYLSCGIFFDFSIGYYQATSVIAVNSIYGISWVS